MLPRVKRTRTSAALFGFGFAVTLLVPALAKADDAAGHYNLCVQYKREAKISDAVAACKKALQLRPNYAAAHMTLGSLYRGQKNYPAAAAEYEQVVNIVKNHFASFTKSEQELIFGTTATRFYKL